MFQDEVENEESKTAKDLSEIDAEKFTNFTMVSDLAQERRMLDIYRQVILYILRQTEA